MRRGIYIAVCTAIPHKHSSFKKKMPQQRNLSSMKMRRSIVLHYWNNDQRSPATIACIRKITVGTVKYNIGRIKEQGTIEDRSRNGRSRKITANDNKALGQ